MLEAAAADEVVHGVAGRVAALLDDAADDIHTAVRPDDEGTVRHGRRVDAGTIGIDVATCQAASLPPWMDVADDFHIDPVRRDTLGVVQPGNLAADQLAADHLQSEGPFQTLK